IHYESSGQAPKRFTLKEGPTMVGRESPDITVAPGDSALSRRHFVVIRKGSTLALKDLGSANGTLIQIDRPVLLVHGDSLVLGQQKLKFSDEREAERPKATVHIDAKTMAKIAQTASSAAATISSKPAAPAPAGAPSPAAAKPAPAASASSAPAAPAP